MSRNPQRTLESLPRSHLAWRVADYLHANPIEVLTRNDVAVKFDTDASTVDLMLQPAISAGYIKREHGSADGTVWRKGSKGVSFPKPVTSSLSAAVKAHRAAKAAFNLAALESIVIEEGIPLYEPPAAGSLWNNLFDRMKAGASFTMPLDRRPSLERAKLKYCKRKTTARFIVRKMDSETVRIWRTA